MPAMPHSDDAPRLPSLSARSPRAGAPRLARALTLCGLVAAAALLALVPLARDALAGRTFRSAPFRVEAFDIPRGWQPASQLGYPKVLLVAFGPDGGRLVLGAQRVTLGQTAIDLAAGARAVLVAQGFADVRVTPETAHPSPARRGFPGDEDPASERARLDATFDAGRQLLRQWYVVDVDVAVVVTVTTPAARPRALKDAETALSSLVFAPLGAPIPEPAPVGPSPAPVDAGVFANPVAP